MRRRQFIAGVGSAAAMPLAARAQQPAMPVIGVLLPQSADDYKIEIAALLQGLKETGFVEGKNVAVEYHYAENQLDRLPRTGSRSRPPPRRGDRSLQQHRSNASKGSDDDHTHRLYHRCGPGRIWSCSKPQPARRERYRYCQFRGRASAETIAIAPRFDTQCCHAWRPRGPGLSAYPNHHRSPKGGGEQAGPATCRC